MKDIKSAIYTLILATSITGCSEILENPLKDKETGEDINLLVIDFNFFDTRLSIKLVDAENGTLITEPATVIFSGTNSNDIVSYAGERNSEYQTNQGQLEVAVDPMVEITENNPFEFAVHANVQGYNQLSKGFQFLSKGQKTLELKLSKAGSGSGSVIDGTVDYMNGDTSIVFSYASASLKSAVPEENSYQIKHAISITDFLKLTDENGHKLYYSSSDVIEAYNANPAGFVSMSIDKFNAYTPEIDVINIDGSSKSALIEKLETGKLTKLVVDGKTVSSLNGGVITSSATYLATPVPEVFGFARFGNNAWDISGISVIQNELHFSYTLLKASAEVLCPAGSSITFTSGFTSSFSIDADIYDMENNLITTVHFKGSFPQTFVLENVPDQSARIVFRSNNPAFKPIEDLIINSLCSGSHEVEVIPAEGYVEYQIVFKALCSDNPSFAIAPTYSGEIRIKDSNDSWQGIDMTGGVTNVLGLPGQAYNLRLLWENQWEYSTYYTDFDVNGNYLHDSSPVTKISSQLLNDGRIQISIEQIYGQSICNEMGW